MSVQQPGVRRPADEVDSFPDPKRSWGRSGSLFATWVVLLVGIYFAGWVFDGVVDKSASNNMTDEQAEDANQAAKRVLAFSFENRTPEVVDQQELLCDDFSGVRPRDLTDRLVDREAEVVKPEDGVLAEASVHFHNVNGEAVASGVRFPMYVDVFYGTVQDETSPWNYDVTVTSELCISKIEETASPTD